MSTTVTPSEGKSSVDEIRARFDADVERFSNLDTGQAAQVDAPLMMDLLTAAAAGATPDARHVLDIGCGAGNYTLKLLQHRPGLAVTLVDLSRPMLDRAEQRLRAAGVTEVTTIQGDVRDVDLGRERFDVVMAAQCLHHLRGDDDWRTVFRRVFDALRPGGGFWIADSLTHELPAVEATMTRRWGEHLETIGGAALREKVFAYAEREDTPRPLTWQLDLLRRTGFDRLDVLHKTSRFAAFGGVKPRPAPAAKAAPDFGVKTVTLRDGRTVTLRRPTHDDAPAMIAFFDAVRRSTDFLLISAADDLPTLEQEYAFIESHANPDALLLLAVSPTGQVVSTAGVARGKAAKVRHRAELGISIDAGWRGVGLGRALMRELIDFCRAHGGLRKMCLSVHADNAGAIHLYESCGFVREGQRAGNVRQLDGTLVDEVVMGLWLG